MFHHLHVTTHIPLKDVSDKLSVEKVLSTIRLADSSLKQLGIQNPRVGVSGLNPHCGEGGLFGNEELKIITPAIRKAKSEGIDASGSVPPDTVFAKALSGAYDVVVAMYHDQGHIPVKMVGFKWCKSGWKSIKGVNITVGLPFIRTSVDHGTAYGKAGKGKGNAIPESLIEALETAIKMSLENQ